MNIKKLMVVMLCCFLAVAFFWSCAGPKEAVKVQEPEKKAVEPEKEVAKKAEPKVEYQPMAWTTALKDADVKIGGDSVVIPEEYADYSLTILALDGNKFEVYLDQKGGKSNLALTGTSTMIPDSEGKIAFHITDVNKGYLQPLFDVIGLRVLNMDELRDNYYLFGSFEKSGVSVLSAYDMGSSVVFHFTRK
jgi:hypothetical protein